MKRIVKKLLAFTGAAVLACAGSQTVAHASSHREAPFITENPKVDGTDVYIFRSYENGRSGFVTLVMNFHPLQDPYGGPNYFSMDPEARYEFKIDNDGDAKEDISFLVQFDNILRDVSLPIGTGANTKIVPVPLVNVGPISAGNTSNINLIENYTLSVVRKGDYRHAKFASNAANGAIGFEKPIDNIGEKSIPDYASYAAAHIFTINIPGCTAGQGRMFVGQRKDPFVVNLGETFDLVNYNPLAAANSQSNTIDYKNVTSFILEVPIACLTANGPVIAGWSTASLPKNRHLKPDKGKRGPNFEEPALESGSFVQVSRLANPLVNEVVIGLRDKDKFNSSSPMNDAQFLSYVTHPTLPALLQALFPAVTAPTAIPRNDLVQVFITGVPGLNQSGGVGEMMRLNTSIPPVAAAAQNNLGVIGGDTAGYPNGRRPGDDVVDISLRVMMGKLLSASEAPSGQLLFNDGAAVDATMFSETFPYLLSPIPGSPT